jgi:hypothetical protein
MGPRNLYIPGNSTKDETFNDTISKVEQRWQGSINNISTIATGCGL